MATLLADNAYGTLGGALLSTDSTLNFTVGHGARFPAVTAPDVLYCCILNSSNILEEVIITSHASGADSCTITRATGGTTAKAWNSGDRIEARISKTCLLSLKVAGATAADTATTATDTASKTGTGSIYVTNTSPTLVTPNLGIPASGTLTNCTGLPIAGGGTGAATQSGAATNLGIIGIGQTYSTPARSNGGSYTNSGAKPILVVIVANVQSSVSIVVAGNSVVSLGSGIVQALSFTFIVPPGATYSATFTAGGIYSWTEMS